MVSSTCLKKKLIVYIKDMNNYWGWGVGNV